MEQDLVSILIPFKNTSKFLPECLNSILDQDYQNWEVLAVNDHSTDASLEIVTTYANKYPRIQLINNTGNGIIPALQTAYGASKGQFITRMDSDDIMEPNKLSVLLHSLKKTGPGHLAVGQVRYFSEYGISDGYLRYEQWLNTLTKTGNNYSEIYKECVIPSPCWMLYRSDLDACDAFLPTRYPEDYDLTFRFYESGLQCIPCEHILHQWRDYSTRTSRTSEHYAHNYFLDIKLYYFLKLHYNKNRPMAIWGAGKKGKTIAKILLKKAVPFHWLCDNPNKIGLSIYGQKMQHYEFLATLKMPQSIITVANEEAQEDIKSYLNEYEMKSMVDHFFFC